MIKMVVTRIFNNGMQRLKVGEEYIVTTQEQADALEKSGYATRIKEPAKTPKVSQKDGV